MTHLSVKKDETLDDLFESRIKIIQPKKGYRFSVDALLLAHFALSFARPKEVLDVGTGCGIIALILACKRDPIRVTAVEVQAGLADIAARNVLLNRLSPKVTVLKEDFRNLEKKVPPSTFDLIVSNPPYFQVSSGRLNPTRQKAIARHEIKGALEDLAKASAKLVKPFGNVIVAYPVSRLVDLLTTLSNHHLEPKRMQIVHSHREEPGKLALVQSTKGGNRELKVLEPLVVYRQGDSYTQQMQKIYEDLEPRSAKLT